MMEPLVMSASVVGFAELGDRTQLLSLVLACRYRRPVSILGGILAAILVCNAIAALAGQWVGHLLASSVLKWIIGFSFIGMGIWVLIPDKHVDEKSALHKRNAFMAAFMGFLIAEMGDKTQIATAALAAHYQQLLPVIIGSTLGMMIVNTPVVLGAHFADTGARLLPAAKYIAATIFLIEAALTFSGYKLF